MSGHKCEVIAWNRWIYEIVNACLNQFVEYTIWTLVRGTIDCRRCNWINQILIWICNTFSISLSAHIFCRLWLIYIAELPLHPYFEWILRNQLKHNWTHWLWHIVTYFSSKKIVFTVTANFIMLELNPGNIFLMYVSFQNKVHFQRGSSKLNCNFD